MSGRWKVTTHVRTFTGAFTLCGYLPAELIGARDFARDRQRKPYVTAHIPAPWYGRYLKGYGTCREVGSHFLPDRYEVRRWDTEETGTCYERRKL